MNDPVPGLSGVINIQQVVVMEAWAADTPLSLLFFFFSLGSPLLVAGGGETLYESWREDTLSSHLEGNDPQLTHTEPRVSQCGHGSSHQDGRGDPMLSCGGCLLGEGRGAGLVEHACQKQCARQAPPHPRRGSRWPGLPGGGRETPRGRGIGEEIEKAMEGGSLECVAGQAVV